MLSPAPLLTLSPASACVFGASGGLGSALVGKLASDPEVTTIFAGARRAREAVGKIRPFIFDLQNEDSLEAAAKIVDAPDLTVIATGILHEAGLQPEKSLRAQTPHAYAHAFAVNSIGPALIAKHMLPRLPRDRRSVFAVLSARVGSITDNRLGGWHAYRASKAALNMIIRNLAIEMARTHPQAIIVALHPGTVDTALSQPFQRSVAEQKLFTAEYAAGQLLEILGELTPEDSGQLIGWDRTRLPY